MTLQTNRQNREFQENLFDESTIDWVYSIIHTKCYLRQSIVTILNQRKTLPISNRHQDFTISCRKMSSITVFSQRQRARNPKSVCVNHIRGSTWKAAIIVGQDGRQSHRRNDKEGRYHCQGSVVLTHKKHHG